MEPKSAFKWASPENLNFQENLLRHVLSGSPEWGPLTSPSMAAHTLSALTRIKRGFETNLNQIAMDRSVTQSECWQLGHAGKQIWFDYDRDYRVKRADLVRQKNLVDDALSLVKPYAAQANREILDGSRDYYSTGGSEEMELMRDLIFRLVGAVADHKGSIERSANVATVADKALWSALARLKFPTRDGELSLREWYARATR